MSTVPSLRCGVCGHGLPGVAAPHNCSDPVPYKIHDDARIELEAIVRAVAELPIRDVRGRNVCPCCDLETRGDRDECCDECPRTRARTALGLDGAG